MRTRLAITACLVVLAVSFPLAGGHAAASAHDAAQGDEPTTTTEGPDSPNIIPKPNSGSEPDDAGDRGGSLQSVLFVVVIGGIVGIGALIVRESRRTREKRGF